MIVWLDGEVLTRFIEQQQAIYTVLLESSSWDDQHLMPMDAENMCNWGVDCGAQGLPWCNRNNK